MPNNADASHLACKAGHDGERHEEGDATCLMRVAKRPDIIGGNAQTILKEWHAGRLKPSG
jgi:hypothetical protein